MQEGANASLALSLSLSLSLSPSSQAGVLATMLWRRDREADEKAEKLIARFGSDLQHAFLLGERAGERVCVRGSALRAFVERVRAASTRGLGNLMRHRASAAGRAAEKERRREAKLLTERLGIQPSSLSSSSSGSSSDSVSALCLQFLHTHYPLSHSLSLSHAPQRKCWEGRNAPRR